MGSLWSAIKSLYEKVELPSNIIILGLDGAGKTLLLNRLSGLEVNTKSGIIDTPPTIGFNTKEIKRGQLKMSMWDIGGQSKTRILWNHFYKDTNGIIFVIDASDEDRIDEAKEEIDKLLIEPLLSNCILLIYINKMDLSGEIKMMTTHEISISLDVFKIKDRKWRVQGCSAKTGEGIEEGMKWFIDNIKK
jgi:small GTP-binding protein